mmetsp:Transcript_67399/g.219570  ORF Transcript_67399/g.219570 Transcript_67399/m.219570 type:complete len:251 (-) Transcript_67399:782-1534(-)
MATFGSGHPYMSRPLYRLCWSAPSCLMSIPRASSASWVLGPSPASPWPASVAATRPSHPRPASFVRSLPCSRTPASASAASRRASSSGRPRCARSPEEAFLVERPTLGLPSSASAWAQSPTPRASGWATGSTIHKCCEPSVSRFWRPSRGAPWAAGRRSTRPAAGTSGPPPWPSAGRLGHSWAARRTGCGAATSTRGGHVPNCRGSGSGPRPRSTGRPRSLSSRRGGQHARPAATKRMRPLLPRSKNSPV